MKPVLNISQVLTQAHFCQIACDSGPFWLQWRDTCFACKLYFAQRLLHNRPMTTLDSPNCSTLLLETSPVECMCRMGQPRKHHWVPLESSPVASSYAAQFQHPRHFISRPPHDCKWLMAMCLQGFFRIFIIMWMVSAKIKRLLCLRSNVDSGIWVAALLNIHTSCFCLYRCLLVYFWNDR